MSTNTFLEFNRDLFLCNTIHDPQNVDGVIPTITDGNLYKKKRTIDPFDNIYILPKNHMDKQAYNNGLYRDDEPISTTYTDVHPDYYKCLYWMGSKIGYNTYITNLDVYLNGNMDVWVGSGKVTLTITEPKPPVVTSTSTEDTEGKTKTITTTPSKNQIDKMLLNISSFGLKGIEGIIKHEINLYNKGLSVNASFKDIQGKIVILKKNVDGISTTTTTETTDGTFGTTKQDSTNSTTYTFSVKGGSLVKVDRSFVGKCKDYNLKTICPRDDPQKKENCEICKNFQYRDWYDQNNPTQINLNARYDDATSEYQHMWLQTWNLGIGIVVLAYGIYYQLS